MQKEKVQLHFTVSPEHRSLFETLSATASQQLGAQYQAQYDISFSEQKSSTDTIAANTDGTPFRNADGSLLFRPGGHGALIENLNDIDADIIFVKTVDNVSPDSLKEDTVTNKQLLAGLLVSLQAQAFAYLEELEEGNVSEERMQEILHFLEKRLALSKRYRPWIGRARAVRLPLHSPQPPHPRVWHGAQCGRTWWRSVLGLQRRWQHFSANPRK